MTSYSDTKGAAKSLNLVFDGVTIAFQEESAVSNVFGRYQAGNKNQFSVTVKNSTVVGFQKVGALVGQLNGNVVMNNVKVENVTVKGTVEAAQLFGSVNTNSKVTGTVTVTNVKVAYNATAKYSTTAAPASVAGINAGDTFVVWAGDNGTAYEGWVYPSVTQNWFWYSKNGVPAISSGRLYNGNVWSMSAEKTSAIDF